MFSIVFIIGYLGCLSIGLKSVDKSMFITYDKSLEYALTDEMVWKNL
jgi:hypothetical protein